jgi:ubiquinone/menaquinone biosynthesis C-methylase UbiE
MNSRHSKVTDWGLSHISIDNRDTILDAACGGGRTVNKLAAIASQGKVYGVDFSKESVAFASRLKQAMDQYGPCRDSGSICFSIAILGACV